jgi:AcrR family transcriptional regulator
MMEPAKRPGLRERKKQALRTHILDVSLTRFRSQGYDRTTVEDICELADVGKATFFRYFPTKQAVLAAHGLSMFEQLQESSGGAQGAFDRLRAFYQAVDAYVLSERELVRAFIDAGVLAPYSSHPAEFVVHMFRFLTELVVSGQEDGSLSDTCPAHELAAALYAITHAAIAQWSYTSRTESPGLGACVDLWADGARVR